MKPTKRKFLSHVLNIVTIALIVESFLCSMMLVRKYAREDCFDRIEETTAQISLMFTHAMDERLDKLTIFADILAANSENPDALLKTYMENFCKTQYFSAVCIHRANGTTASHGDHPHDVVKTYDFALEVAKLPYVSDIFSTGNDPKDHCIYQAVPIIRNGNTIAVLYGYMTLDIMPHFVASDAYGGNCQFYVADGDTGEILMDQFHGKLGNLNNELLDQSEVKAGYSIDKMRNDVRLGHSGYFSYRSQSTGEWYYTCYMPLGINNWSMMLTIDEPTAFSAYNEVSQTVLVLMFAVVVLMLVHVFALMHQNSQANKQDKQRLLKTAYINSVQRALLNAHNNPDFVDQALKIVADQLQAETVLLLSFSDKIVTNAQYWPSKDKAQAMELMGRNIRDDFPTLFDMLAAQQSVIYNDTSNIPDLSETTITLFSDFDVRSIMLVPIVNTAGLLKGTLVAVNPAQRQHDCEMLECVTYDFFMAIANLENHNIIKRMGTMDYLTNLKNRNSYESEIGEIATTDCSSLWCLFIDVNGLHEVNNSQGHKAGDIMLCSVADTLRRAFGSQYTYRLGGDEFLAFAMDCSHQDMLTRKQRISQELAAKGYFVSMGFESIEKQEHGLFDIERVVAEAEIIMYNDKRAYYQSHAEAAQRGH